MNLIANRLRFIKFSLALASVSLLALAAIVGLSRAASSPPALQQPLHPTFAFIDADGANVLESGAPASPMLTCGQCHDTEFIADHSGHANLGFATTRDPDFVGDHPWDISDGYFGDWNALDYRLLSPLDAQDIDLSTPAWIAAFGARIVGGNPAQISRDGSTPLSQLPPGASDAEAAYLDLETGRLAAWDWAASGTLETNCFLCHLDDTNNAARIASIESGHFDWAATATLLGTGIVEQRGGQWAWQQDAFQANGELARDYVTVRDPANENCAQCHGLVHENPAELLTLSECAPDNFQTFTTGLVFSPQRVSNSGLNISGKADLDQSWDIHAERLVQCVDCHYSLNNPIFYEADIEGRPEHLIFDPRRLDFADYLLQPLHQFARTEAAESSVTSERVGAIQSCESCHDPAPSHAWLPYPERHFDQLSCETCHVANLYAPAIMHNDWTVISPDLQPQRTCRGVQDGQLDSTSDLIEPYNPALLVEDRAALSSALGPYNLVSSWYWVAGDPERPVALADLSAAYLDGATYHADVLAAFDADGDGQLSRAELLISTDEQQTLIASRLAALGLQEPRIVGEVQPYRISHGVTGGQYALQDCALCHSEGSRLAQEVILANYVPGNLLPEFLPADDLSTAGAFTIAADGSLRFQPDLSQDGLYILGHDSIAWVDWFGVLLFVGTLGGVTVHGGLRYRAARRLARSGAGRRSRVYMYGVYERLWHWLQSFTILALALTGLIIHKPDMFAIFSFRGVVLVHNILAAILVINAFLALFYHLASGEIRQYIPQPRGFFSQMVSQASYYLRGIFRGEDHPFEKTPEKKLNPLQQIVYFGLLNILLPLQIITGALMWGAQRWPEIAEALGGLPFLGPFHTLIAWSLISFIVMHIYLTTTAGEKPTDGIRSMMFGWEDVEAHE